MADLYRRGELERLGMRQRAIQRAVRDGSLLHVKPGWYATSDLTPSEAVAVGAGGRLTCVSEARELGLWIPPGTDERMHVAIEERGHRSDRRDLRVHWRRSADSRTSQVERLHDDAIESLRILSRCQPLETAFVIAESAAASGKIDRAAWAAVLRALPARKAIPLSAVRADSGSGTESAFVFRMRRLGIRVEQQVQIGPDRVDVVLEGRIIVELDSRAFHDPRRDARRDARTGAAGYPTLRFVYEQVWFEWSTVEHAVSAALSRLR